jgi:putative radical SAM enzyme (TIGR03279 family)
MAADLGLRLQSVGPELARVGLASGDRIVAVDGLVPRDIIDLQLDLPGARRLSVQRASGDRIELRAPDGLAGAVVKDPVPGGIRECNNHCEFCFIRGLPPGLRPTLYVFDDDYRYSFLWGNFLTLTNLSTADWARIGYQRLSPLNVSVHATNPTIRRRLLNNRHAPEILPQLRRLASFGVRVHTQVVVCAGVNDRACLDQTIGDLAELHPNVQSVSIVPVGLTAFSRVRTLRRPTPAEAAEAVQQIERWQARLRPRLGVGFAYGSDELYLLAGRDLPPSQAYDGFPVLSNGVGMLRSMLDDWNQLLARRSLRRASPRRVVWATGRLAAPALERMADAWNDRAGWRPEVLAIDNTLFGDQVGVSGLLSGADLLRLVSTLPSDVADIVLPRSAFGFDGQQTLDGTSAEAIGTAHTGRVHLASTPAELLDILTAP